MTAEVRSVVVKLSMENAQYIAAAIASGDAQVKAQTKAKAATMSAGQALDSLGGKAGKVGAGAAVALGLMAKAAVDWESQWAGVSKTVDGSAEEMAKLEEELRGLATTLPATHEEIAGVAEAAGQLGVAREDIASFTKTMVDLGETTNLTAEDAATSIAQISNVMGTSADDVDNLGSALVALGNDGASTEAQILGMAQRIAGAGSQIGLAESDILAIANAAASMGIEVEAGGSAISKSFTEMAKATKQGGEGLENFASVAGMSADEFVRAFEDDPAQAFASFTSGLDRINKSGGDVFTTLDQLGLSDVRVSQALLGMAASGDLLTDSLALGADAWAENTALAEEAAKRYDTTGAKTQVAWNKIKDAGIDAGDALLPVVASIAEGVGSLADAFGKLPDPVQGVLTKLLAVAAVGAGGFWFTAKAVSAISSTRESLAALSETSPKAAAGLRAVGYAAAAYVALEAFAAAVKLLQENSDESLPGVNALTKEILRLKDAEISSLPAEFDSLGESIRRLSDKSGIEEFGDKWLEVQGIFSRQDGRFGSVREATAEIELLDEALAGLVAQGSPEIAAEALDAIAASSGLTAGELENLLTLLPGYNEALAGAAVAADLAAGATGAQASGLEMLLTPLGSAADGLDDNADSAQGAADATDDFADSVEALNEILSGRSAVRDFQAAIDDAAASVKENGKNLDISTEKGRANQASLDGIAESAIRVAETLKGTARVKFLDSARDDFIDAAVLFGMTDEAAAALATSLGLLDRKKPRVDVDTEAADNKLDRTRGKADDLDDFEAAPGVNARTEKADRALLLTQKYLDNLAGDEANPTADLDARGFFSTVLAVGRELNDLDGDTATTYIRTVRVNDTASGPLPPRLGKAGGGLLRGPGTKTSDSIPIMGSDGEYMVRAAAVDHYGVEFFDRVNALRLAGGGQVTHTSRTKKPRGDDWLNTQLDFSIGDSVDELRDALKDLRQDLKEAGLDWTGSMQRQSAQLVKLTRSYEKQTEKLDRLQDRSDAFGSEVAGSFNNDLFGNGLAGLDLQLQADTNDNKAMEAALKKAAKKGLDGGLFKALAASGDIGTATELAGLSRAEIAAYEKKFGRRSNAAESLGGFAADEAFGAVIRRQERFLDRNEKAIVRLVNTLEGLPGHVEEGTRKGWSDKNRRTRSSIRAGVR